MFSATCDWFCTDGSRSNMAQMSQPLMLYAAKYIPLQPLPHCLHISQLIAISNDFILIGKKVKHQKQQTHAL